MLLTTLCKRVLALLLTTTLHTVMAQSWTARCTYHDYEGDQARYGIQAYDDSPGWCGIRYSSLNLARVTAAHTITPQLCGKCLAVQSASSSSAPVHYLLMIDQKGDPGLDIAKTSFQALFPNNNPLDPETCNFAVVDDKFCSGICFGSTDECTPGVRNSLPAYLLPPVTPPPNSQGLGGETGAVGGSKSSTVSGSSLSSSSSSKSSKSSGSSKGRTSPVSTTNPSPPSSSAEGSGGGSISTGSETEGTSQVQQQTLPTYSSSYSNMFFHSSGIQQSSSSGSAVLPNCLSFMMMMILTACFFYN